MEYRGYDSAGVALVSDTGSLNVYKAKGKVSDLERSVEDKDVSGHVGIAHTRWATHGEPCAENAHPHYSASGNLALIHNGIIENYATLKERLIQRGVEFRSQTDSEVLVQLIEYIQVSNDLDLLGAVQVALHEVIGAYAIAILDKRHPEQIIAARKSSPLVVGIGHDNDFYLASDATPIVEYTDKVVYLEDGDIAVIRPGHELKVVDMDNTRMHPTVKTVDINLGQLEKGGYPFFMLKEIFEQPDCLCDCMRGRINVDADNVTLSAVIDHKDKLLSASRFIIVACGTSWHAGLIGQQLIESFCRIPSTWSTRRSSVTAIPSSCPQTWSSPYRSRERRPTRWPPSNWRASKAPSCSAFAILSGHPYPGPLTRGLTSTWGLRSESRPPRRSRDK